MRAQRVLRPILSIEEVLASLETFGDPVADRLDGRQSSPGDAAFSYRQVFDDLRSDLVSLRREVVAAEDEHVRRKALASALRREIEVLGKELYEQQVAVRQIFTGAYGRDRGFELAALSGNTPRTLKPLEEQVDQTVKLLREPRVDEPSVKVAGVEIDLDRVADGLARKLEEFRVRRAALDRARKAVAESKVMLDRALDRFQSTFPWIAQALEAHFRRVGEHDLADRVRTSIRRVTRRQAGPRQAEALQAGPLQAGPLQAGPRQAGPLQAGPKEAAGEGPSADPAPAVDSGSEKPAPLETVPSVAILSERRSSTPSSRAPAVLRSARRWLSPRRE